MCMIACVHVSACVRVYACVCVCVCVCVCGYMCARVREPGWVQVWGGGEGGVGGGRVCVRACI